MSSDTKRILVLGNSGFLGKSLYERLEKNYEHVIGVSKSQGVDLRNRGILDDIISEHKINVIFNCAATVGGIEFGRMNPVAIFNDNLQMSISILESASKFRCRLINPISNCSYPRELAIFKEEDFWSGPLDDSVLVYGMVRKMSLVGAWAYNQERHLDSVNLVLPNLYGPGDHWDPVRAHALGALVSKFIQAKILNSPHVEIWGTGKPVREWLFIDDAVNALISAINMSAYRDIVNVGTGEGLSIAELAEIISSEVGFNGNVIFDLAKPDGAPHKTMDGKNARELLNWQPLTPINLGIRKTVAWYRQQIEKQ